MTDAQEGYRAANTLMVGPGGSGRIKSDHHRPDSFTLVYVDLLQRMVSHTIRVAPTAAQRPPLSRTPSHTGVIGLPNPLNILRATHLGSPEKSESTELAGRIEVDDQVEWGVVPLEGTILANRSVLTNNGRRTIFWTESGLSVGTLANQRIYSLTSFRLFKRSQVASRKFG